MTAGAEVLYRKSATKYADPAKVEKHAPVAGLAPFTCTVCGFVIGYTEKDTVHWVSRPCVTCKSAIVQPPFYACADCLKADDERRESERLARLASYATEADDEASGASESPEEAEKRREGSNPLYAEAKAYALAYKGDFDFMLDMKRRVSGFKGERGPLSQRQIEAILKCKKADEEKAKRAAEREQERQRNQTGIDLTQLPEGRTYAAVDNESGGVTFLIIDRPGAKDRFGWANKWAGWVFVKQQQGSEEVRLGSQRPGETYSGQWPSLINKVLADPVAAVARYGLELGVCGVCGRALTNEESREQGIGPICLAKLKSGF